MATARAARDTLLRCAFCAARNSPARPLLKSSHRPQQQPRETALLRFKEAKPILQAPPRMKEERRCRNDACCRGSRGTNPNWGSRCKFSNQKALGLRGFYTKGARGTGRGGRSSIGAQDLQERSHAPRACATPRGR